MMHHGQQVLHYREMRGLTQQQLADELNVHLRTVQRSEESAVIRSIKRRWLLVGLLGIPAADLDVTGEPPWSHKEHLPVNNDLMGFFEDELAMRWELYYTAGPVSASRGLTGWMKQMGGFVTSAQGTPWHKRALVSLSMSYQLQGSVLREAEAYIQAHTSFQNALRAASEANNAEMMAGALLREGMVYMAQKQPFEAVKHFNAALDDIKGLSFPRLRGKLLESRAEAYAFAQRSGDCWTSIGLAERLLGNEEQSLEHSQTNFSSSSVALYKGLYALLLNDHERALTLFDKGLASPDSSHAPTRARFLARKAEAYYGAQKVGESIDAAQESFNLAHTIGKKTTIERVRRLHKKLSSSRWKHEKGVQTLAASLEHYDAVEQKNSQEQNES